MNLAIMQTSGEGVQNPQNSSDIICTWSLKEFKFHAVVSRGADYQSSGKARSKMGNDKVNDMFSGPSIFFNLVAILPQNTSLCAKLFHKLVQAVQALDMRPSDQPDNFLLIVLL